MNIDDLEHPQPLPDNEVLAIPVYHLKFLLESAFEHALRTRWENDDDPIRMHDTHTTVEVWPNGIHLEGGGGKTVMGY